MTYTLPPFAHTYDALDPRIDNEAYVDKLNAALEGSDVTDDPIEETLSDLDRTPEAKRADVSDDVRIEQPAGSSVRPEW